MNETEIGLLSEQEQAVGSREAAEKLGARIDELVAEQERLHRWKREASEVMSKWEAVWEALGRPGKLGRSKAEGALAEVENLRAELAGLRHFATLQTAASARAITLWQAAHPDRSDIWPDQAALLVWLLEQLDAMRAERDGLEARLRICNWRCLLAKLPAKLPAVECDSFITLPYLQFDEADAGQGAADFFEAIGRADANQRTN